MANMEIYQCRTLRFCADSHRLRDVNISNVENVDQGNGMQFPIFDIGMVPFDGKYQIL